MPGSLAAIFNAKTSKAKAEKTRFGTYSIFFMLFGVNLATDRNSSKLVATKRAEFEYYCDNGLIVYNFSPTTKSMGTLYLSAAIYFKTVWFEEGLARYCYTD